MLYALSRKLPFLEKRPEQHEWISIAAYGPSLRKTWWQLTRPILSVSGAHDFLIDRGIVPDYHLDMDPRKYKTKFIERPHPDVTYLMATVCHPSTWDILEGKKVFLWHTDSGKWTIPFLKKHDPESTLIWAGSDCGLAAIQIGGMLGHYRFNLHGFDHSLKDGQRHAGQHHGFKQEEKRVKVHQTGREFVSTDIMMNSAAEVINTLKAYPLHVVLYGDGLIQDTFRGMNLENIANAWTWKALKLRWRRIEKVELRKAPKGYRWEGSSLKRISRKPKVRLSDGRSLHL